MKFATSLATVHTHLAEALDEQRSLGGSLKFLLSRNGCPVRNHTSRKHLGDFSTRLTEMEHDFSAITARMCKSETYAA